MFEGDANIYEGNYELILFDLNNRIARYNHNDKLQFHVIDRLEADDMIKSCDFHKYEPIGFVRNKMHF